MNRRCTNAELINLFPAESLFCKLYWKSNLSSMSIQFISKMYRLCFLCSWIMKTIYIYEE